MKRLLRSKILRLVLVLGFGTGCAAAAAAVTSVWENKERFSLTEDAVPLSVEIDLQNKHTCRSLSPPIRVGGVPAGTKHLEISVTDLNILYDHGGGTVAPPANGEITEGALSHYVGPCPGDRDHTYRFRVNARDDIDKVIGIGEVAFPCCSNVPGER